MPSRNDEDVQLLYHDPRALLLRYQTTINIIVQKFVASGFFAPDDKADIVQTINELLLRGKLRNMQAQYNYSAYVVTYFSKVVYNLCLELRRKAKRETLIDRSKELHEVQAAYADERGLHRAVITQEVRRLKTILQLFGHARAKLELCLGLCFRFSLKAVALRECYPLCSEADVQTMLAHFGGDYEDLPDKEVYARATPILNRCEGKANSPDALRKWISLKTEEIIALLNGGAGRASYDRDTLKILWQKYAETESPHRAGDRLD